MGFVPVTVEEALAYNAYMGHLTGASSPFVGAAMKYQLSDELILLPVYWANSTCSVVVSGSQFTPVVLGDEVEKAGKVFARFADYGQGDRRAWERILADPAQFDIFASTGLLRSTGSVGRRHPKGKEAALNKDHLSFNIIVNSGCNLRCSYCYEGSQTLRNDLRAKPQTLIGVVEQILASASDGTHIAANFIGGEPLLNWEIVVEVAEHIARASRRLHGTPALSVQTNLTFLPKGFVETVRELDILVMANIDGPEAIHNLLRPHRSPLRNSYRETLACLETLRHEDIDFCLRCTIAKLNADCLLEVAQLHTALGAKSSMFVMLVPVTFDGQSVAHLLPDVEVYRAGLARFIASPEWRQQAWRNSYRESIEPLQRAEVPLELMNCSASSQQSYTIGHDGHIYNCAHLVGNAKFDVGAINELNEDLREETGNLLARQQDPVCGRCAYRYACNSACLLPKLLSHDANDPLVEKTRALQCATTKTIVDQLLVEMALDLLRASAVNET